jgi:hypothetical protein
MVERLKAPRVNQSTKTERHIFWQQAVDLYNQSGLSNKDFCQQHGLRSVEFRRWKYRLSHGSNASSHTHSTNSHQKAASTAFVPLRVDIKNEPTPSAVSVPKNDAPAFRFIVKSPYNVDVEIPAHFQEVDLLRLLQVLEKLPC